jgi:hypothetical protein
MRTARELKVKREKLKVEEEFPCSLGLQSGVFTIA